MFLTFHYLYLCCDRWLKQHEYIQKFNMQAILNASAMHDEFIKELLVSHEKVNATTKPCNSLTFVVPIA